MAPQSVASWQAFENVVAALYRKLGVPIVKQNIDLGGNQIDVYLEELTGTGGKVRTAVECKYYAKPVPKDVVVRFSVLGNFLRTAGLIDKAVMVGYKGFTQAASAAAATGHVELVSFIELESRLLSPPADSKYIGVTQPELSRIIHEAEQEEPRTEYPQTVFVAMPFSDEMEDVYWYGIRQCVHQLGLSCVRADEIEHSAAVIDQILDQIRGCRAIVAEVSDRNPNVFYEIGWAHALGRETILVAREGTNLPFDVSHINTILYGSIRELETRLRGRLSAAIG